MKLAYPAGLTSVIVHVFIPDSTSTAGAGKTALVFGNITAYYVRAGGTLTALTMETIATLGTWASTGDNYLGFKLLHDTNAPGLYELNLPNNILAAGANQVVIQLRATGAAPTMLEIQLKGVDVSQISNDAPAADNCELMFDGTGYAGGTTKLDVNLAQWLGVAPLALSSQQVQAVVPTTQKVDVETIKTQAVAVTAAGTVTFPNATVASTTNITAGTVTLANGAHGGAAATLTLLSAVINNTAGSGLKIDGTTHGIEVTASAGPGIEVDGTTFGVQIDASAGPGAHIGGTTIGLDLDASAGLGVDVDGTTGGITINASAGIAVSVSADGGNGDGISIAGNGTGDGMVVVAGASGNGIKTQGGSTIGSGLVCQANQATSTAGNGISAYGYGTNSYGIRALGGVTSGPGMSVEARANNDAGLVCLKNGTGKDIDADQIDSILADTGTDGVVVASHTTAAKAQINAEVVDAINVDTYAEPGQGAPAATASLVAKIGYLFKGFRNKWTQTATEQKLFADNTTTVDQKATISDDLTTFTRGELGTGA